MIRTIFSISSLLCGIALVLMGLALLATSLGIRAVEERYSDAVMGLIMASYFVGFVIGSFILPPLVRRIGPIRTYAALAAIGSVCAFMHALLVMPLAWAALRCIMGIALVGIYMVVEGWLNGMVPNQRRGKIFGVYMMVTLGAQALGQFLLLLDPGATIAAFGIAASFFSLGIVPVALTRRAQPAMVEAPTVHLAELRRRAPLSLAAALAAGLVTASFWGLGAVFASRTGLPAPQVAAFMAALIAGGVLLQWPVGHFSDHHDRRHVMIAVAALGTAAAVFASFAWRLGPVWLYVSAATVGGMIFTLYGLSVAYLNDRIHSDAALDAARGILLVFGVGSSVGPVAAGLAMEYGGPSGLPLSAAVVLGLFALYAIRAARTEPPVSEADRSTFIPMDQTSQAALELDPRLVTEDAASTPAREEPGADFERR
ncbi:MAG: MFS transporter [Gammaproteobacteria bacterium]|jgi:MFS family permease|nr:MFS transporter [Gammaproteobacteria bacterium]